MTEVELKAAISRNQAAELPGQLLALGFREQEQLQETDLYFNGDGKHDFRKTDEGLRLRTCRNLVSGVSETLMTYKGPKTDLRSSTRKEHETAVGNPMEARKMLEALGFAPVYTVEKTRRTFSCGSITACLDQVEHLGDYLELEILLVSGNQENSVDILLKLLDRLGVSRETLTRESYLELLVSSGIPQKTS